MFTQFKSVFSVIMIFMLVFTSVGDSLVPSASTDNNNSTEPVSSTKAYLPTAEPQQVKVPDEPIPTQLIVQFDPASSDKERATYIRSIGGTLLQNIDSLDSVVIALPKEVAQQSLPVSAIVAATEPDYYVSALDLIPNDPRYAEQWALPAIDATTAWGKLAVDAPRVTVAVIDSGVCASHPDIAGRLMDGWDFIENDATAQDQYGHGCSVSGIIAANVNDGMGIAGIAPNAQIMPLRVLNADGIGSYSNVAAAIAYAVDHNAQIINLSLGGSNPSAILVDAINYAVSKGVIVVAAAGNSGTEGALFPAAYPNVIAVGSIDPNLQHSSFSNYGSDVDLWAPGRDILTTRLDGSYGLVSGTSIAAPYVAGAKAIEIALGKSILPTSGLLSFASTIPTATETPVPATETPVPTQLPTTVSSLDPSTAGIGSLYRVQIRLKQSHDLARLGEWSIKVLDHSNGYAVTQVTSEQLSKLARLGFEPAQIDSVEYMLAVQSASMGNVLSLSDVTSSAQEMIALASVDSDSDGLTDTEEAWWCTNPQDNNSDFVGNPTSSDPNDGAEVQAILNSEISYGPPFEMWPNFRPYHADGTCLDGDFDGVPDNAELYMIGTSPQRESSDKDKFDDGQELFGVTFCPASSGPCGYGILPRAEDAAFVTANLPAWVKAPGNSPFVAAFPEPEVSVVPSSIIMTQKTVITNTKGTTVGTEKTYGTSSTKGTSTSLTETQTWNNWQSVSTTRELTVASIDPQFEITAQGSLTNGWNFTKVLAAGGALACVIATGGGCAIPLAVAGVGLAIGDLVVGAVDTQQPANVTNININNDIVNQSVKINTCSPDCKSNLDGVRVADGNNLNAVQSSETSTQNRGVTSGTQFSVGSNGNLYAQKTIPFSYPIPQFTPTITNASGSEVGGSRSTTSTEYEEQTISESSTNQYSDNWSQSIATDPTHAADLRFTYNIVNSGTEYAREVTSLTFNIYIGNDSNPAITYCAVGSTSNCELPSISNLFPDESLTYTAGSSVNTAIRLTDVQMRAIDEGVPIRIVMEDIAFGQDQVFYQDAFNGSVLVAMEDGFDDSDETIDSYLIPVWDPNDKVQDVVKRFFPVTEDMDGNLLSISTPEFNTNPPTFVKHSLTGTSWWNIYLSEGLDYVDAFKDTTAKANSSVLIRIVTDSDLDGYNNRNEIRIGTNPDDPASHPSPNLVAGYTKSCTGNDCTVRMVFQNLGNYDAYGVEAIMYSPDGLAMLTNNTIGGSGRVEAGQKVIISASDTFQYTKTVASPKEPVIVVSYNDPQGNHRFILPASALLTTLNDSLTTLDGQMLPDPGVDIASTDSTHANFVIFSPHAETITNGKLFVEYIDAQGNVTHEDVFTQDFVSGPTVVPVSVDTGVYPPDSTILLAFFTDSQGNIIDSSARPLASFGADPLPEANLTTSDFEIGAQGVMDLPNPWDFGTINPGTTLYANITLGNTGLGDLRYSLTGWGNGVTVTGISSGNLSASDTRQFTIKIDTTGMPNGAFNKTLTLRTNDPNHASIAINITGTIGATAGTATAYKVNDYHPWDQYVYVPGPHNQNDVVTFTNKLADDPSRMFPLYLYSEDKTTLKGVGEYGVDFSGQTAPFGVFGTGADGDLTVTNGQTIYTDNTRSVVSGTANKAQPSITLSSAAGFAAGQEVLIVQIQGVGAGLYEFANIANVNGNIVTLTKNLTNTYTAGGVSKAQLIRVMQYHDVTIQSGGILTAHSWDGSTGGVLAFRASGFLNVVGAVRMNGVSGFVSNGDQQGAGIGGGFRGGNNSADGSGAWAGEGIGGNYSIESQTNQMNGGGGAGGYNYGLNDGAGGGYGSSGGNGSNSNTLGGSILGNSNLSSIFFGGGGGGGRCDTGGSGGAGGGGSGGGIIITYARSISVMGAITSNGGTGASGCANGGGGAGGSIFLSGQTINLGTSLVTANGGVGPNAAGDGGVGRIRIQYSALTGTTSPSASAQQVNYYSITGQGAPFGVFGNGSDGDLTVTIGQTIYTDNIRSALASTVSAGQSTITLSNATGFAVGKEILIIQSQGTAVGAYEFAAITSVNGDTITLSKPLGSTHTTGGNSKAQVIVVPQYHNVTVQSGGILTAHDWDGNIGGILAFRSSGSMIIDGTITVVGRGFVGGQDANSNQEGTSGYTGEGFIGPSIKRNDTLPNSTGGGGGRQGGGNGGGGGGSHASQGTNGIGENPGLKGDFATDNAELNNIQFGGGGGAAGGSEGTTNDLGGGNGGGIILIFASQITINGSMSANGNDGRGISSLGGGGGAGGSILMKGQDINIGTNRIQAIGGIGMGASYHPGGNGGLGRIYIEYTILTGSTNPAANTQQVNYYNLTGSSSNTLYVPDTVSAGSYKRYVLLYGQRSVNTNAGDQLYMVHLTNRQYSLVTLSALVERVVNSGSTFNFCLDFGNDGTCDYTANNQSFTGPVRLDSPDLKNALNTYIAAQNSSAETLTVPIRVNISTPADIFLFNLSATPGADADLVPTNLTITPPNGNPPSNIPEGSQVTLSASVHNYGTHLAENFTVAFYNGDPTTDGVLIGSTFVQSLAPGATSAAQSVMWNTTGLLGNKSVYVQVDPSSSITEFNEANNASSSVATIKKKADLLITSLNIPDIRQNETGNTSVTVKNEGEADVIGAVIKLYKGSPETGTVLGSTTVDVAQGATVTGQISFSLSSAGVQALSAKVDPTNVVLEADETNNVANSDAKVGWDKLTIDAGGLSEVAYSPANGAGYVLPGTVVTSCGTQIEKSYRQAGSAENLTYQIDNLLPGRRYHLDLTFATCSGDRWINMFVDNRQVYETFAFQVSGAIPSLHVTNAPQTVSILLDPADYADGSITLSLQRASGLNGPLVNIIDLQEITYCYRDSGPAETAWNASNRCGYDPAYASDGFNGWGMTPEKTVRFSNDQNLHYKFTSLVPTKLYNTQLTFYEGDSAGRIERMLFDGTLTQSVTLGSTSQRLSLAIPQGAYADGTVDLNIQRTVSGDSIVSEVTLEENTRAENNRYATPPAPSVVTPTPTPSPTPTVTPQVTLSSFTAAWATNKVNLAWSTTTEINNSAFKIFRSTDSIAWTEIASVNSTRPCGNYTGTTPVPYSYSDQAVSTSNTYYYRLQYSAQNCGGGLALSAQIVEVPAPDKPSSIRVTIGGNPMGNYSLARNTNLRVNYANLDSGPVKVESTTGTQIVTSLRDLWWNGSAYTSSIQLMGLPQNLISDTYVFPSYNNVSLNDQLRFGNVGNADTTVTVTIGGVVMGNYLLHPNDRQKVNYAGLDNGPVIVKSSNGVPIIASIRDAWIVNGTTTSFSQLMGLPQSQLSDTYIFPSYNNVSLSDQLRFGNVGNAPTTVTVTIGGVVMGTYNLQPNQREKASYTGLDSGPVIVHSSNGVPIIASLREAWLNNGVTTSYFQMMGLPQSQLSDKYVFPSYDNVSLSGQLRFGNVGNTSTTVTVTIGGQVMGTYDLAPNQRQKVSYNGLDDGPVVVQSSNGVPIVAALRDAWLVNGVTNSFSQLMGLPGGQLSTTYVFPSYNNATYDNQLRIGVP